MVLPIPWRGMMGGRAHSRMPAGGFAWQTHTIARLERAAFSYLVLGSKQEEQGNICSFMKMEDGKLN